MLALLAVAARLRRGVSMIAASALMTSMPLAMAQQYPPSGYPNPGQSPGYPGAGPPWAYPDPGYGANGAPPPPRQEAIPPPPGVTMGLATRVLELEEARLGVGVRQLRLTPVPRRVLGCWPLEPTTRRLDLGAGALAMIARPCARPANWEPASSAPTRSSLANVTRSLQRSLANATRSLQRLSPRHSTPSASYDRNWVMALRERRRIEAGGSLPESPEGAIRHEEE